MGEFVDGERLLPTALRDTVMQNKGLRTFISRIPEHLKSDIKKGLLQG